MSTFLKSCLMTVFGCAEQDLWHGEDGIVLLDDSEQAELLGFDLSSALHLSVRSTHTRQKAPGDTVRSLGSEPSSSAVRDLCFHLFQTWSFQGEFQCQVRRPRLSGVRKLSIPDWN